ncbi:hypothetical protein G9A89_018614 [Geosiphon pyriformis]|nr:hypothetical protein G9A89_018614 [Geosiphon pyriformis]
MNRMGTSTQSPIFAVELVVKDALEKDRELWLVLQNMRKAYNLDTYSKYGILIKELSATTLREELTELRFWEATDKTTIESLSIIQKTPTKPSDYKTFRLLLNANMLPVRYNPTENQHQQLHPKVAESESIGANHLRFIKSLFQHYCQHLELNHNHISAESVFNFYINEKITYLLGTSVNIESAKETFYNELIQNTSLPTNHNFTSIITKINKEIKYHTQKTTNTSSNTPKNTTPTWKKTRVKSPINPSYHYTPRSAINITSIEEKEEESENQEFTYQNPITENSEFETPNFQMQPNLNPENLEIKTLNIQTLPIQDNQNPKTINQQNLPPEIIINQPPIELIIEPIQQQPLQQPIQHLQQPIQQPPVPPPQGRCPAIMANNWDNQRALQAISYFLQNTADSWYQSLAARPQNFQEFKLEFLRYFSNNNSINCLTNTFITIKQRETEAVVTYLRCFHRNLRQIQAIDADYFTVPQILNQFICGLCSSILQHVCTLYSNTLQDAVTHTRNFESAELEANYTQAINLVMNRSSELDSKLKQFSDSINQKLEGYLADNHTIY